IFNDKHTQFDPVTGRRLEPAPFVNETVNISGNFSSGQLLPTLNLSRVFVLSGSRTCSASESIINSLRGIDVEVVLIGGKTCGKPYGFYPFDNCGTTYFSVHFAGENAKNFGEYSDGFKAANDSDPGGVTLPGCLVADDLTREFGDPSEAMLAAALQYRQDESCPPIAKSKSAKLAYVRKDGEAEVEVPSGFAFENIKIMNR
ncbi:MAG: peptidase, partial [Alteromonadaceae bacterium]